VECCVEWNVAAPEPELRYAGLLGKVKMDDLTATATDKTTPEESARRREVLRRADARNRLEGLSRNAETDPIFEAFVRGEIDVTEIVPRLKAQLGLR
jgi:hypothetical protein